MSTAAQRAASRGERPVQGPEPRAGLWLALAVALAGLVLSLLLVRLHRSAHAGESSFCAISETVDCDRVATSRYSVVLGLPVAVWGAVGFALMTALAGSGLSRRRPHPGWPAGLLVLLGAGSVAASLGLALVSKMLIGAWCLLCAGVWVCSLGMLFAARRSCGGRGVAEAVRADLAALRSRLLATSAFGVALLGALAIAALAYPRYWERPRARAAAAAPGAPRGAPRMIVLYSDYECPFCARAHEEDRSLRAANPGVTIVKRHFPLDSACNPAVARRIHPLACERARAAICADAQGQGARMDEALFAAQGKGTSAVEIARSAGLDAERLAACLDAPETARRLAEDVASGVRDGIKALPTYFVDGVPYVGSLPPGALAGSGSAPAR